MTDHFCNNSDTIVQSLAECHCCFCSTWDAMVGLLGKEEVAPCELSDRRVLADIHTGTHDALAMDKERQAE